MFKQTLMAVTLVASIIFVAGCNRNYTDITMVSSQIDTNAAGRIQAFDASTSASERRTIKSRIVEMRKKQVTMAERIDVASIPGVKEGQVSRADADAKKAELVAKAKENLAEAEKLPVDPPAMTGAAEPTPAPVPTTAAPK